MADGFKALILRETDGKTAAAIETLAMSDLPAGEVTVSVEWSTLNYKDGLVVNGLGRLVRKYPHVPGIDFAGTVEASDDPRYKPGDAVILTGWRVGELHWGGYARKARVNADWLVKLPDGLTPRRAMAIGTAGFTAMLSVLALEAAGITPDRGEIVVTGANGGLGGVAIAILARLGYDVAASTGRPDAAEHLKSLGAKTVIDRAELSKAPDRPLLAERWAGAIDSVGDTTLASILAATKYNGAVAACGLAGGNALPTTVLPFILRGVRLLGIDSVMCPFARRQNAWRRLARDLPAAALDAMTHEIALEDLPDYAGRILKGQTQGRVVVNLNAS